MGDIEESVYRMIKMEKNKNLERFNKGYFWFSLILIIFLIYLLIPEKIEDSHLEKGVEKNLTLEDNLNLSLSKLGYVVLDIFQYDDKISLEVERAKGSKQIQLSESLSELIEYYNVTFYKITIVDNYETCIYRVHRYYVDNDEWGDMVGEVYDEGVCLE